MFGLRVVRRSYLRYLEDRGDRWRDRSFEEQGESERLRGELKRAVAELAEENRLRSEMSVRALDSAAGLDRERAEAGRLRAEVCRLSAQLDETEGRLAQAERRAGDLYRALEEKADDILGLKLELLEALRAPSRPA